MATATRSERLTVGGYPIGSPACVLEDPTQLMQVSPLVGSDVVVPGVPGARPRRRTTGPLLLAVSVLVFGDIDDDGQAHANPRAGLAANLAVLDAAVEPPAAAPYTVSLVHRLPDGTTRTADGGATVRRVGEPRTVTPDVVRVVLDVRIPSGTWTVA